MGGYLLFNIEFPNKEARDKFENVFKVKRMFQYKDGEYDCTYYPRWMGYAEPQDIINICKTSTIKITKFLSVDLSTQSSWFDEIKQKTYVEK